jgi:preprotein translocase subunit SecG
MLTVLIAIHLMIVMAMIGMVLLQRSEGGGLGVAQTGGFLSSRGTANVLTRTTAILAAAFFFMSLTLSVVAGYGRRERSILQNTGTPPTEQAQPGAPPPLGGQGGGGVLEQLQKQETQAPPAAPSGPQVPRSQ